jgi:YidC/Oxa1 family membrane protein insertase
MQRIQPEIKKLQQQYKDDRQKQNEELMKFYQENNINPLSGCLPLVIQMPVLFALFRVLRSIQDHIPTTGQFNRLFTDLCAPATSAAACKNPVDMHFLGLNLMVSPANSGSVTSSFIGRLPYFIAVAAVVASAWYQMWQTQLRQKRLGNAAAQNNPINKQMQVISRVFPIFFGWFAYIASSGLVLYFVTSALWRIGQQHLVLNKYYDEQANVGKKKPKPAKPAAAAVDDSAAVIDLEEPAPKKQLPPNKPAPASGNGRAKNGSTNGSGNGAAARSQQSPHTSRKKKKRRR